MAKLAALLTLLALAALAWRVFVRLPHDPEDFGEVFNWLDDPYVVELARRVA